MVAPSRTLRAERRLEKALAFLDARLRGERKSGSPVAAGEPL
jgi:hypothetical protein